MEEIKKEEEKDIQTKTEDEAIVLDYMPSGKSSAAKTEALAQVIGTKYFTLLEVTPKLGKAFSPGEKVYVGREDREKVELIKGRIAYKDLTSNSMSELNDVIEDLIEENKQKYVDFFNKARPISLKRHQLELLPGIGKKHVLDALDKRDKKEFESFEDIISRVKGIHDPKKAIIKRIVDELEGPEDKHYIFVRPPQAPRKFYDNRGNNRGFSPRNNFRKRF